jgi:phenylacetate-CoA ligase
MLLDAVEHVPFYRQHWAKAGVDLTRIGSAVHLEFLPLVTRADLLDCPAEQRLDRRFLGLPTRHEPMSLPGGDSFDMHVDKRTLRRRRTRFWHALCEVGYSPGERVMLISDSPLSIGAAFLRWAHASASLHDDAMLERYARVRPQVLHGPLGLLVSLAERVLATPEVTWRPRIVISAAGELTDAKRTLLESAFRANVADFYSATELGLVAYSKPGFPGYELVANEFHVEMLPAATGRRTAPERLVVTDLVPGAMPLIRFDTADLVQRDWARASALSPAPIVGIRGREPVCVDRRPRVVSPPPIAAEGSDLSVCYQ